MSLFNISTEKSCHTYGHVYTYLFWVEHVYTYLFWVEKACHTYGHVYTYLFWVEHVYTSILGRKSLSYIWTCMHISILGRTSQKSAPERFYKVDSAAHGLLTRQQGKTLEFDSRVLPFSPCSRAPESNMYNSGTIVDKSLRAADSRV